MKTETNVHAEWFLGEAKGEAIVRKRRVSKKKNFSDDLTVPDIQSLFELAERMVNASKELRSIMANNDSAIREHRRQADDHTILAILSKSPYRIHEKTTPKTSEET